MKESKVKSSFWTLMASFRALIKGWLEQHSVVIGHSDDLTCVSISHGSSTCLAFYMHGWLAVLLSNLILESMCPLYCVRVCLLCCSQASLCSLWYCPVLHPGFYIFYVFFFFKQDGSTGHFFPVTIFVQVKDVKLRLFRTENGAPILSSFNKFWSNYTYLELLESNTQCTIREKLA
jgi:hypothetical protein